MKRGLRVGKEESLSSVLFFRASLVPVVPLRGGFRYSIKVSKANAFAFFLGKEKSPSNAFFL